MWNVTPILRDTFVVLSQFLYKSSIKCILGTRDILKHSVNLKMFECVTLVAERIQYFLFQKYCDDIIKHSEMFYNDSLLIYRILD